MNFNGHHALYHLFRAPNDRLLVKHTKFVIYWKWSVCVYKIFSILQTITKKLPYCNVKICVGCAVYNSFGRFVLVEIYREFKNPYDFYLILFDVLKTALSHFDLSIFINFDRCSAALNFWWSFFFFFAISCNLPQFLGHYVCNPFNVHLKNCAYVCTSKLQLRYQVFIEIMCWSFNASSSSSSHFHNIQDAIDCECGIIQMIKR